MNEMDRLRKMVSELPGLDSNSAGMLYHDIPGLDLPALRSNTLDRFEFLLRHMRGGQTVLDIGCANGGLSILLNRCGWTVTGWDRDPQYIEVAGRASRVLGGYGRGYGLFEVKDINTAIIPGVYDIILFLSVFKWIWFEHGEQVARDILHKIAQSCNTLIFESGLTGTGIDLIPMKVEEVEDMLDEMGFESIEMVGCFPRDSAHNVDREVWVCQNS